MVRANPLRRTTGCKHSACVSDEVELHARNAAAAVLGDDELVRVCEQETVGVKPDFESGHHVLEVKELTSPALRKFFDAHASHREDPHVPIEGLSELWRVWADVSDAVESFDDRTPTPKAKSLIESLAPLLADMEARGVTDAFCDERVWPHIRRLLGFQAHCSVIPGATPGRAAGIHFGVAHGHERTTYLEDDVVKFLQRWLDSDYSANARNSLARDERNRTRVVALAASMDGPAAVMLRTLSETPGEQITAPLRLPSEIDAVIVTAGHEVLHFDRDAGWARYSETSLDL